MSLQARKPAAKDIIPRLRQTCLWFTSILLLIAATAASSSAKVQVADPETPTANVDLVVRSLCSKRVALLGEPPIHGFGSTLEFKAQLVRRLVQQCHYNALFLESGVYDYIHIDRERRSGQDVPESMISAALGGLWANKEVQSLVPFLRDEVKAGRLRLGGLDDQIGAGSYASREMSSDLARYLQGDEHSRCLAVFERHLRWQYTEEAPYRPSDKGKIVGCLHEVESKLSSTTEEARSMEESRAMVESLQRNLARNFTEDDFTKKDQELNWFNDRDRSMYLNLEWLAHRLPPAGKIIVWAATVHTAKDLSGVEGFEGRVPLGSYVHKKWTDQAFSLGFSAYSGEYAFTHQPTRRLSEAPPSSLEAQSVAHHTSDTLYLSGKRLDTYKSVPARLLGVDFKTARWEQVVDGLVVFRVERAPAWSNLKSH